MTPNRRSNIPWSIGVSKLFCAKSITPDGDHLIFALSRKGSIAMSEKEKAKK